MRLRNKIEFMTVAVVLAFGLSGCGQSRSGAESFKIGISAKATSSSKDIIVAFARDGERGDLPALLAARPHFASELAAALLPRASGVASGTLSGTVRDHEVLCFLVGGAKYSPGAAEIELYAHDFDEDFAIGGGQLIEATGVSMPVRIVLSAQPLRLRSIDQPEEGEDHASSLALIMPSWAVNRLDEPKTAWDTLAVRDAAGEWAKRSGLLARLVYFARPQHADPHRHVPDVYGLRAIPLKASGFYVQVVQLRSAPNHPNLSDLEKESSSRDGRYVYYFPLTGYWPGVVIHDRAAHRWLHVGGPGLNYQLAQRIDWVGNTLVFDAIDVGFSPPRPRPMTMAHVEVDLEKPAVDRVVPIGPYTGNWPPPAAAVAPR